MFFFQSWIQGLMARGQGQGQGLVNWSLRTKTRTFFEDNNT